MTAPNQSDPGQDVKPLDAEQQPIHRVSFRSAGEVVV
jgi:hypothetical protein